MRSFEFKCLERGCGEYFEAEANDVDDVQHCPNCTGDGRFSEIDFIREITVNTGLEKLVSCL